MFLSSRLHLVCLLAFLTCGGSAAAQEAPPAGSAHSTARVRLFGQNGVLVEFYQNSACIGGNGTKTSVSGGPGDAFSSFFGRAKNTAIGMKETPNTQNLGKRDGMMSKAYFREYEVAANEPLAVRMHFQSGPGVGVQCGSIGGTFVPQPGKDYEIGLELRPGQCMAIVQEIVPGTDGQVVMQDIDTAPVSKCQ
jgi:hypothetical protein